jgi:hypothetical protein
MANKQQSLTTAVVYAASLLLGVIGIIVGGLNLFPWNSGGFIIAGAILVSGAQITRAIVDSK